MIQSLQDQSLTRDDVLHSLTAFEPIWESLTVREQSRIVQLKDGSKVPLFLGQANKKL